MPAAVIISLTAASKTVIDRHVAGPISMILVHTSSRSAEHKTQQVLVPLPKALHLHASTAENRTVCFQNVE
jgi:hypothetical protein